MEEFDGMQAVFDIYTVKGSDQSPESQFEEFLIGELDPEGGRDDLSVELSFDERSFTVSIYDGATELDVTSVVFPCTESDIEAVTSDFERIL